MKLLIFLTALFSTANCFADTLRCYIRTESKPAVMSFLIEKSVEFDVDLIFDKLLTTEITYQWNNDVAPMNNNDKKSVRRDPSILPTYDDKTDTFVFLLSGNSENITEMENAMNEYVAPKEHTLPDGLSFTTLQIKMFCKKKETIKTKETQNCIPVELIEQAISSFKYQNQSP